MQAILEQLIYLAPWLVAVIVGLTLGYGVVIAMLRWRQHCWLLRRKLICLELRPLANEPVSLEATGKLFEVLHGMQAARRWLDKLWRHLVVVSLEVQAGKADGIRYLLYANMDDIDTVEQAVRSYMPNTQVKRITSNESPKAAMQTVSFRQTGHYAFPLALEDDRTLHDPVSYLTGIMTRLDDNEQMSLQYVVEPVQLSEADRIAEQVLYNEELVGRLRGRRSGVANGLFRPINSLLFGMLDAVSEIGRQPTKQRANAQVADVRERRQIASRQKPARTLSIFEQQLVDSMHAKVSRPLFRVSLRTSVVSDKLSTRRQRLTALKSALSVFAVPKYQGLRAIRRPKLAWLEKTTNQRYLLRLPNVLYRNTIVLGVAELARLYHFPRIQTQRPENVARELSRVLSAPVSLKANLELDVLLGQNIYHGTTTAIGLTAAERERHVYIIGGTGNGKTTVLQYAAVQDMQAGKGLAVIDPHGDMAETLLRHVPSKRMRDVVYFNPDDLEFPMGLNLLELTPGLSDNALLREKDLITESVVSVFRKIFSDEDTGGHRIEYVLRNTIQTALTVPDATLFTVFELLNDPKYRKGVIKALEDKNLINFWKNELGKAGDMQKVKMAAGITAKIGRFLFSASARQVLEQPTSTIDFDDIINSGKILICNFSKGLLGEDTSELFGITVLAKLQLASLRRARLNQTERCAFYLYVDEFQNFATPSFVQMLSEARKYRLFMTMAEQSTSQQKDQQMVSIILANVGTVICFRTGNPQDERLLLPLFSPYIEPGEISNLSSYRFYAKLSALKAQEPLSGETLLLKDEGNESVKATTLEYSRNAFAKKRMAKEPDPQSTKPKVLDKAEDSKKRPTGLADKVMLDLE